MSEVFLRDPAAERAVVASVLTYGADAYLDVADIVTSKTFTIDSNQLLWACLEHVFKEESPASVDYPTILSAAHSLGLSKTIENSTEQTHIRGLLNMPVAQTTGRKMAGKIRRLEIARLYDAQLEQGRARLQALTGDESIDKIISTAEEPIFDLSSLLTNTVSSGPRLMGEGASEYIQHLMDNPREMMGIPTGIKGYDRAIGGGLRVNSLDIIAARLKCGKTMLVDNTALHIAGKGNIPVFNLDTEMSWEEHLHRIIANLAGIQTVDIETGKCGFKDIPKKKVLDAADRLKQMPYYYECLIGRQFEEALASMRRWVTRTVGLDANGKAKPCVIIYDYLKMLSADFASKDMQEHQALGFITSALKNFMGRYSVPCLCFAQMNREGIDREDSGAVAGSDRIAQYATSLTFYKWKSDEERAEADDEHVKYTHKLIPIVSRHGAGLSEGDYINIQAEYSMARITEGPTRNELLRGASADRNPQGVVVDWQEEDDEDGVSFE